MASISLAHADLHQAGHAPMGDPARYHARGLRGDFRLPESRVRDANPNIKDVATAIGMPEPGPAGPRDPPANRQSARTAAVPRPPSPRLPARPCCTPRPGGRRRAGRQNPPSRRRSRRSLRLRGRVCPCRICELRFMLDKQGIGQMCLGAAQKCPAISVSFSSNIRAARPWRNAHGLRHGRAVPMGGIGRRLRHHLCDRLQACLPGQRRHTRWMIQSRLSPSTPSLRWRACQRPTVGSELSARRVSRQ